MTLESRERHGSSSAPRCGNDVSCVAGALFESGAGGLALTALALRADLVRTCNGSAPPARASSCDGGHGSGHEADHKLRVAFCLEVHLPSLPQDWSGLPKRHTSSPLNSGQQTCQTRSFVCPLRSIAARSSGKGRHVGIATMDERRCAARSVSSHGGLPGDTACRRRSSPAPAAVSASPRSPAAAHRSCPGYWSWRGR